MYNRSRRNRETCDGRRRNREAPLKLDVSYDVVFDESPLASELLAFNINRKREIVDLCLSNIKSDDSIVRAKGAKELAEVMETDPRLVKLLHFKDVDRFIGFLELDRVITIKDNKPIQYYAAAILKVVFRSKCMGEVITHKALPLLVKLLDVENCNVIEHALSSLTTMMYIFPNSCKDVLELKVLGTLRNIVTRWAYEDDPVVSHCAILLGAICTGHPNLSTVERNEALDIARTIHRFHAMPEACVALAKLSDGRRYIEVTRKDFEVLITYAMADLLSSFLD